MTRLERPTVTVPIPEGLAPITAALVRDFAVVLASKLRAAEQKYGYSAGWSLPDWEEECRKHLYQHLAKGDPRDVAIYCAFMWRHGWSTAFECKACGGQRYAETRLITCDVCDGEGRDLRGHPDDPHPKDYGPCPICQGDRSIEVEVHPVELEDMEAERASEERKKLEAEEMTKHFRNHPHDG